MRWIWRALTRRLLLKFTALLCAVILWIHVDTFLVVEGKRLATVVLDPPLAKPARVYGFRGVEGGGGVVSVQITVRGSSRRVRRFMARGDVHAVVKSDRRFDTKHLIHGVWLTADDFEIPPGSGISIVAVSPYVIQVWEPMNDDLKEKLGK